MSRALRKRKARDKLADCPVLLALFLCTLLLVSAFPAEAVDPPLPRRGTINLSRELRHHAWQTLGSPFEVADTDGDGTPEVNAASYEFWQVIAAANDTYEREWISQPAEGVLYRGIVTGDADLDGTREIYVSTFQGTVEVYSGTPRTLVATIPVLSNHYVTLVADVDGDGRGELLCSDGDTLQVRSTLSPFAVEWQRSDVGGGSISVGNVDGDPGVEVVVAGRYEPGTVLDGATGATEWSWSAAGGFGERAGCADIDGDGMDEIVGASPSYLRAYDADIRTPKWEHQLGNFYITVAFRLRDLDGDGVPEAMTDGRSGNTQGIVCHDLVTLAEEWFVPNYVGYQALDIDAGDLDGDGHVELVSAAGQKLRVTDTVTQEEEWLNPDSEFFFSAVGIGEVDGDGEPEVAAVSRLSYQGRQGILHVFNAGDWSEAWQMRPPGDEMATPSNLRGRKSLVVADTDLDGLDDITVTSTKGYSGVVAVIDGTSSLLERSANLSGTPGKSLWANCDDEGGPEILVGNGGWITLLDGPTLVEKWRSINYLGGLAQDLAAADIDGDGVTEIIAALSNSYEDTGILIVQEGSGTRRLQVSESILVLAIAVRDIDGDGVTEVLLGRPGGVIEVRDGSTFALETSFRVGNRAIVGLRFEELDGWGNPELIVSDGSRLHVLDGTTGDILFSSAFLGEMLAAQNNIAVGDPDGDGLLDIVVGADYRLYSLEAGKRPRPPEGFAAVAGGMCGSISLAWQAVPEVSGYRLWRLPEGGDEYSLAATLGSETTSYSEEVPCATTPTYALEAFGPGGTSPYVLTTVTAAPCPVVRPTADGPGSIDPGAPVTLSCHDRVSFVFTAAEGAVVHDILADGSSVGPLSEYLFEDVLVDHAIRAVFNAPPVPRHNGPWYRTPGQALLLEAAGSCDDGEIASYAWDLDGDGTCDDASGPTATLSSDEVAAALCGGTCLPDVRYPVTLRVTDDLGLSVETSSFVVTYIPEVHEVCVTGCAYDTIQAAIDESDPWDVVQIAAGTHRENLLIERSLTLRRGAGLEITALDAAADQGGPDSMLVISGDVDANGAGDGSVVTIAPPAGEEIRVRLENLVLTGGWAGSGGGLLVTAAAGGTAAVAIVNTVVALNDATSGGGIALKADGAGSAIDLQLLNSTVGWNDAREGGGIWAAGLDNGTVALDATNQIVWGNRSTAGEDVHIVQQDGGTVRGNADSSDIGGVSFGAPDYPESWNPAISVIGANPRYANPGLLDLRLFEDSPAIDAGVAVAGLVEDFEGDARPQGSGVDIGADEHAVAPFFAALKLTSLNGGERIAAGEPYLIAWGAPAGMGGFKVSYSVNGGSSWVSLTRTPLAGARSLAWQVPRLAANAPRCLIKVTGVLGGRTMSDVSDKPFTVEVVRVLSPNGKEHLLSGDAVPIVWKTFATRQPVASTLVQYSVSGGSTWKTVATLTGNPGFHEWTVPAASASTGKCRVRVVLRAATGTVVGKDGSDANFNAGKVLVLEPNGGPAAASGGTVDFAWDATPDAVSFDLLYTLDGSTYLPLPGGQDLTGTSWRGTWPVAGGNALKSAVKVAGYTAAGVAGVLVGSDLSDAFFTTEVVRIESPNGGEAIAAGSPTTIAWSTNATIRPVAKTHVSTSVNGGSTWSKIVLDGNPGTLSWTPIVTTAPLNKCKVKVELRDAAGKALGSDFSDALFTVRP